MNPDTIRAFTPIIFATIGGIVGICVLFAPNISDAKWSAGMGFAGTAIAGAAGLAQSNKSDRETSDGKQLQNRSTQTN